MRVDEIRAFAFGPFAGACLPLAPGLNVVYGPNEAGKSSWHAALYAGLCGRRRGSRRTQEELAFRERHKPWSGTKWETGVLLTLEDGRRVELRHDLEGNVNCRALDADLGRDVSAEIMHEGSPDGSRFLGLDRRAFLATACVRQADLLGVRDHPELLQEHLQRAAATAGTDESAAAAIARLDAFQREHVGKDQANAVKPLRTASQRVHAAEQALAEAQERRESFLALAERVERLEEAAATAQANLSRFRADAAEREAAQWEARRGRVEVLERTLAESRAVPTTRDPNHRVLLATGGVVALLGAVLASNAQTVGIPLVVVGVAVLVWAGVRRAARPSGASETATVEAELRATLDGSTLGDLRAEASTRRQVADRLRAAIAPAPRSASDSAAPPVETLEQDAQQAKATFEFERGRLEASVAGLPSVAECEEALEAARAELARVRDLDRVLELTRGFLVQAQERVHRDVAPVIAASVRTWLPSITGGRHVDVRVDPASLDVKVLDSAGEWRQATLLSHGTAEQVYLLIRVALAQHLTTAGEVCPLVLDDATVQSDCIRTRAIMEALHGLSRERQVVLFTQEEDVLAWAQSSLTEPRDALRHLSPRALVSA